MKFTSAELQLVSDAGFIHSKNAIIDQVISLFGSLSDDYKRVSEPLATGWPQIFGPHPKISKGEKHEDLPWVMLDYPRLFDKQGGYFAIRTFFWWGNYFSIQLQVSGGFINPVLQVLPQWLGAEEGWYIGFTNNAWDMTLPNPNWVPYPYTQTNNDLPPDFSGEDIVLKLAKKIPIEQWESVEIKLSQYYAGLISLATEALAT